MKRENAEQEEQLDKLHEELKENMRMGSSAQFSVDAQMQIE